MKSYNTYTVSNILHIENGIVPVGAIIKIKSIKNNIANISIKPFIINEIRTTITTNLDIDFILKNTTR